MFVLKKKYLKVLNERNKLLREREDLNSSLDKTNVPKKDLKIRVAVLVNENFGLSAQLTKYEREIDDLNSKNCELVSKNSSLAEKNRELVDELIREQKSNGAYKGKFNSKKEENEKLKGDLTEARKIIVSLENQIKKIKERPTVEELKTEKMNKVDRNKIVGAKKRGNR